MSARKPLPIRRQLLWNLPREQRDSVFVLAVVAVVLAPQAAYQPWWTVALAVVVLLWRTWQALQGAPLPKRWVTHGLLALSVVCTYVSHHTLLGSQPGVTLIVLLLVLKTLEMRARRDSMVVFFLGFFVLSTLFLNSQSLPTAVGMLLGFWGLLAALVNAHLPVGRPALTTSLAIAAKLLLWGTPLVVLLFVLFPRLPPLWGLPTESNRAKTGLSDGMQVGNIAQLAQDHSVAMRLRFLDTQQPMPTAPSLYFRGPTLQHFDGLRWSEGPRTVSHIIPPPSQQAYGIGPSIAYEATMEPHGQQWLMTLDATLLPPQLHQQRVKSPVPLQWNSQRPITDVVRYRAQAHLNYRLSPTLSSASLQPFTQLPAATDPRTRAWGQQLHAEHGSHTMTIVAQVLQRLRSGGYRYTLEPQPVQQHTADNFWFDQKAGFCEHIASAFVVLLRAAQVPARIVTGYQGGEMNPIDGLWTIRQSDAHAWAEVWVAGEGWVRIDPTASVSPTRISQQMRLQSPSGLLTNAMDKVMGGAQLAQLRAAWEAAQHHWNQWVLAYSERQQTTMLQWLQRAWQTYWYGVVLVAGIALLAVMAWRRSTHQADPWLRLLDQARQHMQAQGIPTAPYMGTRALADAAIAQWGVRAQALHTWLERMERMRYATAAPGTPSLRVLRKEFRALRWPPASSP